MSDSESVKSVNVGDVVAWGNVKNGWLVKDADGWHALRMRGCGIWVGEPGEDWLSANQWGDRGLWRWTSGSDRKVTIIATGLTGQETATDLQRMAEVYEVRAAVQAMRRTVREASGQHIDEVAERLHAAGWRPGMTAEDAARLLSEANNTRTE